MRNRTSLTKRVAAPSSVGPGGGGGGLWKFVQAIMGPDGVAGDRFSQRLSSYRTGCGASVSPTRVGFPSSVLIRTYGASPHTATGGRPSPRSFERACSHLSKRPCTSLCFAVLSALKLIGRQAESVTGGWGERTGRHSCCSRAGARYELVQYY